ncbi:C6 zinc finger domain protein [Colletotrichum plurivorum]|uniref:C6 zinc finger domain protein n=1 Tax=Colletotrichum plurivorum TaxID=2175906 RepID=A0A8H6K835_9PEZI|nr:C6 zinc finger domain protein [Colletotrichum plurivorum]
MARKGSRKVRTGCITCKIRKVKCDEAKPSCNRCVATGRKCDGYQTPTETPVSTPSYDLVPASPYGPYRTFPGVGGSHSEGRALEYFCSTVGPFLSGSVDPYFWTHIVLQFSAFEPSVRHSLVAISNLYEQIDGQGPASLRLQDQSFALQHYNAAINELKVINSRDKQPIVLIACVLFICIEFLQSNREAAVRHCKHGVAILRNINREFSWTQEHLLPMFRRLSELVFYFGEKSDCPDLSGLERPVPAFFRTYDEAQLMIDDIYHRTNQMITLCDPYRSGPRRGDPVCDEIVATREHINRLLDVWHELFANFSYRELYTTATRATGSESQYRSKILRGFLITRYESCRVWVNLALEPNEDGFDRFLPNFKRVAKVLKTIVADVCQHERWREASAASAKFVFETGFTPMLFTIVATCRHLETRLQILQLMPLLGRTRESLWEKDTMFTVGRRMVEIEHSICIDDCGYPLSRPSTSWPPKRRRVIDVSISPFAENRHVQGQRTTGKVVQFFQRSASGGLDVLEEFVVIRRSNPEQQDAEQFEDPEASQPRMRSIAGPYAWDIHYPERK